MKKTALLLVVGLFLALFAGSVAADSMLEISDLIAKVDGDKESANENGGTIDVIPDSELTLKIEVTNLFERGTDDADIENIEVEAYIEGIDDGDDLDEDADDFDLRPGRDKSVTLKFDIPLKLETKETYSLFIHVEGEDQNNTVHEVDLELEVEVNKEKHELRFLRSELSPSEVACGKSTVLYADLINTGEEDEEVELVITSSELDYEAREEFDLYEDIDDDENEFSFSDKIDLDGVEAGTYEFLMKATYHNGRDYVEQTLVLELGECEPVEPVVEEEPEEKKEEDVIDVVVAPQPTVPVVDTVVAEPVTKDSNDWLEDNKWLVAVLLTDLVLVLLGIVIIVAVLRRRH